VWSSINTPQRIYILLIFFGRSNRPCGFVDKLDFPTVTCRSRLGKKSALAADKQGIRANLMAAVGSPTGQSMVYQQPATSMVSLLEADAD
jgi:hypothetical protein